MLGRWLPVSRRPEEASRELRFARRLATEARLTLAFITDEPNPGASVSALRAEFADIEFSVVARGWKCLSSAVSLAAGDSGTLAYFRSAALTTRIADRARTRRYEVCCVSSSSMIQYALELDPAVPIVMDFGMVESQWWLDQARSSAPLRARFYRTEATRLRMAEAAIARRAVACIVSTEAAARVLETLAPGVVATVIPDGADGDSASWGESTERMAALVWSAAAPAALPAELRAEPRATRIASAPSEAPALGRDRRPAQGLGRPR